MVLVRTMQQIGVEEQGISRLHFNVDEIQSFKNLLYALHIGPGLIACQNMFDPPQPMRPANDLEAAILPVCAVYGNVGAGQIRKQDAILIPLAIILVPGSCAADLTLMIILEW